MRQSNAVVRKTIQYDRDGTGTGLCAVLQCCFVREPGGVRQGANRLVNNL